MTSFGVTTIPAGARGFDALSDPVDAARLGRDGWRFRTFYICQANQTKLDGQKITENDVASGRRRIMDHLGAGLGVILNFESANDRWTWGAAGGQIDGRFSLDLAIKLGCPPGVPILPSWDTDITVRTLDVAIAYGVAFAAAVAPRHPIGCYGENSIIRALELHAGSVLGWNVMASAWDVSPASPATVHCQQRRPTLAEANAFPYVRNAAGGWALDVNDAKLPFPAWGVVPDPVPSPPTPTPTPTPTPGPTLERNELNVLKTTLRPELRDQLRGNMDVVLCQVYCLGLNKISGNPTLDVGPADGDYGPRTQAAAQVAQALARVPVDGVIGPVTWNAWLNADGR